MTISRWVGLKISKKKNNTKSTKHENECNKTKSDR